jgi:hypothetical protein
MKKQRMRWLFGLAPLLIAGSLTAATFEPLFRVVSPKGICMALVHGTSEYVPVQKGKAYPFGTAIRCGESGGAVIVLSAADALQLEANTTVDLAEDPGDPSCKILRLRAGRLSTRLSSGNPERALTIETPVAACSALAGTVTFGLAASAVGSTLSVQTDPASTVKVVGPQFIIPALANGAGVRIATAADNSFTRIDNLANDYPILLNRGTDEHAPEQVDGMPNQDLVEVATSKRAAVKIWRSHAPVGGTLIFSAMITDAQGKVKETFAFAVGKPSLGSRTVFEDLEGDTATNAVAPAEAPEAAAPEAAAPEAAAPAAAAPQAEESAAAPETGTVEDLF